MLPRIPGSLVATRRQSKKETIENSDRLTYRALCTTVHERLDRFRVHLDRNANNALYISNPSMPFTPPPMRTDRERTH